MTEFINTSKSEAAAALGRMGKGKPKTMTPEAIAARRRTINALNATLRTNPAARKARREKRWPKKVTAPGQSVPQPEKSA
jgi:hypothetical protein